MNFTRVAVESWPGPSAPLSTQILRIQVALEGMIRAFNITDPKAEWDVVPRREIKKDIEATLNELVEAKAAMCLNEIGWDPSELEPFLDIAKVVFEANNIVQKDYAVLLIDHIFVANNKGALAGLENKLNGLIYDKGTWNSIHACMTNMSDQEDTVDKGLDFFWHVINTVPKEIKIMHDLYQHFDVHEKIRPFVEKQKAACKLSKKRKDA